MDSRVSDPIALFVIWSASATCSRCIALECDLTTMYLGQLQPAECELCTPLYEKRRTINVGIYPLWIKGSDPHC
jgi:hypothetical protein